MYGAFGDTLSKIKTFALPQVHGVQQRRKVQEPEVDEDEVPRQKFRSFSLVSSVFSNERFVV